jgi:hypothetical protein
MPIIPACIRSINHNDRNYILEDKFRTQNTHSADTDAGFSGSVSSAEAAEDDCDGATDCTKEGGV